MKSIRKRALSILLSLIVITSAFSGSMLAVDVDSSTESVSIKAATGELVEISKEDLQSQMDISESEALEVARSFLKDALTFGDVAWDEDTAIVGVRKLYDETEESRVTAYSFELTSGYIMVSAYWDSVSLIPEWSDEAEPVYAEFSLEPSDRIIYLGAYEYYKDDGNSEVESLYGQAVQKDSLENLAEGMRSIDNVPESVLQNIASNRIDSNETVGTNSGIENPFDDASGRYNETFSCSDYVNIWGEYTPTYLYTCSVTPSNYYGECGPVAITNMVLTYARRYPECIILPSRGELFETIADLGIRKGYYVNDSNVGTYTATADSYIDESFSEYAITTAITVKLSASYSSIKYQLERGALLYYCVSGHQLYGNHAVLGFAYTRLVGQSSGVSKVYMKVADGLNYYARYIDISAASGSFYSVTFP